MNINLERGLLLYQQSRYELAEREFRQALGEDPHNAQAHAFLALCLLEREQFQEATEETHQAIHLAPDTSFGHYALARVMYDRHRFPDAIRAINEAIRLDSDDANYFSLLAGIHFAERRWGEALSAAEQGLEFDPGHIGCTNLRAMALVKLGRKSEAGATIDTALSKNPDNADTHANQGWTLLDQGDPKKALEHFREALRLEPDHEWARHGIVEALKARNIIYALMLKYFLWMAKLSKQAQWGVILGGYFGNQILVSVAHSNPNLSPWIWPVRIVYLAFVVLTWIAYPMFNLLLRLNSFGRLVLTPKQNREANLLGWLFIIVLLSLAGCIVKGFSSPWGILLAVSGLLALPLAGTFRCSDGWPRTTMIAVTISLAAIGAAAVSLIWLNSTEEKGIYVPQTNTGFGILALFFFGIFGSSILVNFIGSVRPRR